MLNKFLAMEQFVYASGSLHPVHVTFIARKKTFLKRSLLTLLPFGSFFGREFDDFNFNNKQLFN